ncbi:HAD hydrolase-like protein [Oscillatoria sp. CS-180]|uniref:HAD family hydrolase n=1 Tax=Oscillatoria sp. CS-180 TaxID=3021720 RepID=UPI00232B2D4E|nr:HAD hydrolase-like protein [Oscillatoria sp. CS-180]MDB9527999.1 HAD hydrolase-like protein [Oscillatoria sp. CS-180]
MQNALSLSARLPHRSKTSSRSSSALGNRTLFCDFDGPIADVSERYYSTYKLALSAVRSDYAERGERLPIRRLTKAQFWYMKQNRTPDTTIADWSGLSGIQVDDFLNHVATIVNQTTLLQQDQLQPGAKAALHALQDRGHRIVIVTLRQAAQVLDFLHQHDLATTVSQIYGADTTTAAYPNRTEHKIARLKDAIADQQRLGCDTTQSCMIGDTEADICAGQAADIPAIAVTCGIRSSAYLKGFTPSALHRDLYAATQQLILHPKTLFRDYHSYATKSVR